MNILIRKVKSLHQVIAFILGLWVITFFFHERFVPYRLANKCNWGDVSQVPVDASFSTDDDTKTSDNQLTNILFITDPQLIDGHTYRGRNKYLLKLSQHTVDVYLRKNFKAMVNHLRPNYIYFLGDYLDNGRSSTDEYFHGQYKRFKTIFPHQKFGYTKDVNFITEVPGNHDIGVANGVKVDSRDRFEKTFGLGNSIRNINGVDIISIDSPSLIATEPEINSNVKQFIEKNFGDSIVKTNPRILLSHIPLYRDPTVEKCGPLREAPGFILSKGYQYKLFVDYDISAELIRQIKPDLIFSGDDHDYCDVSHNGQAREITVKSISMAMGIWYPGVQLLSFKSSQDQLNYDTQLCYLPTPYLNIIHYVVVAIVSGLILLWWNINQRQRFNYSILPLQNINNNSKKISNFLKDQDNESSTATSLNYLPNYTNTTKKKPSPAVKLNTAISTIIQSTKKLNFFQFIRHSLILVIIVISIYYCFCITI